MMGYLRRHPYFVNGQCSAPTLKTCRRVCSQFFDCSMAPASAQFKSVVCYEGDRRLAFFLIARTWTPVQRPNKIDGLFPWLRGRTRRICCLDM